MHLEDTDRIYGYGGVMHVSGVGGDFNNTLYKAMHEETKRLLASVIHQYRKVKIDIDMKKVYDARDLGVLVDHKWTFHAHYQAGR